MATIKPTKTALRDEQKRLKQFRRYLPTLELKKALLQLEIHNVISELDYANRLAEEAKKSALEVVNLLGDVNEVAVAELCKIAKHEIETVNIAGIDVPNCKKVIFKEEPYSFLATPFYLEAVLSTVQNYITRIEQIKFIRQKLDRLKEELRVITIRVNLFKKILIPRAEKNIREVRLFLSEQALSEVIRSKFVKDNILQR